MQQLISRKDSYIRAQMTAVNKEKKAICDFFRKELKQVVDAHARMKAEVGRLRKDEKEDLAKLRDERSQSEAGFKRQLALLRTALHTMEVGKLALDERLEEREKKIKELTMEIQSAREKARRREEELAEEVRALTRAKRELESQLAEARRENTEVLGKEVALLKKEIESRTNEINTLDRQLAISERTRKDLKEEVAQRDSEIDSLKDDSKKLAHLPLAIERAQFRAEETEQAAREKGERIKELEIKLDRATAEVDFLRHKNAEFMADRKTDPVGEDIITTRVRSLEDEKTTADEKLAALTREVKEAREAQQQLSNIRFKLSKIPTGVYRNQDRDFTVRFNFSKLASEEIDAQMN